MEVWAYQRSWLPEASAVSMTREFVAACLAEHRQAPVSEAVRVVVSELVTNAVRHARTPFSVMLERRGLTIRLQVTDSSPALPMPRQAEAGTESGRGLAMVEALSDSWGVTTDPDGGKAVWATFPAVTWLPE